MAAGAGAELAGAIEDPRGDHGVFRRNAQNVSQVLTVFEGLTK